MHQMLLAGLANGREDPLEHLVSGHALAEPVIGEHDPVAQNVGREIMDVLAHDVSAPAQQRERTGRLDEPDRPARTCAELDVAGDVSQAEVPGVTGRVRERDGVADHLAVDHHALGRPCMAVQILQRQALPHRDRIGKAPSHDGGLLTGARVVDEDLHQEAIDLSFG